MPPRLIPLDEVRQPMTFLHAFPIFFFILEVLAVVWDLTSFSFCGVVGQQYDGGKLHGAR